jgi:hypothetical protein
MDGVMFFWVGALVPIFLLLVIVMSVLWRRERNERRFAQAMMIAESFEQQQGVDLAALTSMAAYKKLLEQAVLERCEAIEVAEDDKVFLVSELVEIAEAYGNGLVKRSKGGTY